MKDFLYAAFCGIGLGLIYSAAPHIAFGALTFAVLWLLFSITTDVESIQKGLNPPAEKADEPD